VEWPEAATMVSSGWISGKSSSPRGEELGRGEGALGQAP